MEHEKSGEWSFLDLFAFTSILIIDMKGIFSE
jgi:hypothetical protein